MVRLLSDAAAVQEDFDAILMISQTALVQEWLHPRPDEHGCFQVLASAILLPLAIVCIR